MKKLSTLNFLFSTYKGFTLIELLVVIALISILATSLMWLINPLEQISRGNDTANTSDARQLLDAVNRFYANQGYYPWQSSAANAVNLTQVPIAVGSAWLCPACTGTPTVLSILASNTSGGPEINSSFVSKVSGSNYNTIYIYNGSTSLSPNQSTYVCFKPKSKAILNKSKNKWNDCNSSTMGTFSDLGAGSAVPYQWPSTGTAIITICDSSNNLYATCLP